MSGAGCSSIFSMGVAGLNAPFAPEKRVKSPGDGVEPQVCLGLQWVTVMKRPNWVLSGPVLGLKRARKRGAGRAF